MSRILHLNVAPLVNVIVLLLAHPSVVKIGRLENVRLWCLSEHQLNVANLPREHELVNACGDQTSVRLWLVLLHQLVLDLYFDLSDVLLLWLIIV